MKNDADDAIDRILSRWATQRPELDAQHLRTLGRVQRISMHLRLLIDRWLAPFGLSWETFDLLISLHRSGPTGMRPTELYEECLLSSGAMTNRIDRAQGLGLISRRRDPNDGRAFRIVLTAKGRHLIERAMAMHFSHSREIANNLSSAEQNLLSDLLRKLLGSLETLADGQP
jgi:DNA-binding MarR family transcriptional regulator